MLARSVARPRSSIGLGQRRRVAAVCRGGTSMTAITLVSFDVDGTLIHSVGESANKLHKEAFAHGFKATFDLDTTIDVVQHHGSTDPLIVIKVLEHHGVSKEQAMSQLPLVTSSMIDYWQSRSQDAHQGIALLPGVVDLLQQLKARSVATCLVTGNLEIIGWGKMSALKVQELFTEPNFGGFGSDYCSGNPEDSWKDRAEFVRVAAAKCLQLNPGATLRHFHVGDTPNDILAAVDAGAVAIGVATGIYSREQLEAVAPGKGVVVLDGLTDVAAVMQVLGV